MKTYDVHTGKPSWHQQRAGFFSAAVTSFTNKDDAETYAKNCRKFRPNEPVLMIEVDK